MSCIRFCSNRAYHVGTGSTIQTTVLDENGTLRATQRNAVCIMYKDIISQIVGVFQCAQANNNQILLYFEPLTLASTRNREGKRVSKNEWDWVFWGHTQTMVCLYIRLPSHLLFNVHNILRRSLCRAFSVLVCNESSPIWCKLFQAKTETLRIDEMKKSRIHTEIYGEGEKKGEGKNHHPACNGNKPLWLSAMCGMQYRRAYS